MRPGPKLGYKQSPEHIAKRKKWGADHHAWIGAEATEKAGRSRALRRYVSVGPCTNCGARRAERHHIDGNTLNNATANIAILCRKCHMASDGRLDDFRALARRNNRTRASKRR